MAEQKPLEGLLKHRLLGPNPRGYFIWETWAWPQLETLQLVRIPRCRCWLQRSLCNPPLASASVTSSPLWGPFFSRNCLVCWGSFEANLSYSVVLPMWVVFSSVVKQRGLWTMRDSRKAFRKLSGSPAALWSFHWGGASTSLLKARPITQCKSACLACVSSWAPPPESNKYSNATFLLVMLSPALGSHPPSPQCVLVYYGFAVP